MSAPQARTMDLLSAAPAADWVALRKRPPGRGDRRSIRPARVDAPTDASVAYPRSADLA